MLPLHRANFGIRRISVIGLDIFSIQIHSCAFLLLEKSNYTHADSSIFQIYIKFLLKFEPAGLSLIKHGPYTNPKTIRRPCDGHDVLYERTATFQIVFQSFRVLYSPKILFGYYCIK